MRGVRLVVGLLLVVWVSGCSGGTESYCSSLRDQQKQLARLSARSAEPGKGGAQALSDTVTVLDGLREQSPDDISDDWDTLVGALQALADAVDATGAAPSEFAGGRKPAGVTQGQYQSVVQAATELRSTRVQQAGKSIEQHARDVCKVDLGSGLGGAG